ncbi:hypothetical protein CNR22_01655 [Sphingobacteriaceae bacterium]|nr:hypothetical protein CNR22_01655 [Sphingobacteriaceae bacterium]
MKILLVPTDFSHEAGAGVEYAATLANTGDFKILLLHAFDLSLADVLYTRIVPATHSFKDAAHDGLASTKDLISRKTKAKIECLFEEGTLMDAIHKTVNEQQPDYIIMGTRGAKGLKKLFGGSKTSQIIRKAQCPVISIPEKATFKGLKKVCFASGFHRDDIEELRSVVELVRPYQGIIKVVHAAKPDEDRIEQVMYAFEKNIRKQISNSHFDFEVIQGMQLQETLERYLDSEQPDLFAISTRKRQSIERIAGPGISESLSLECRYPILIFHQATPPLIF